MGWFNHQLENIEAPLSAFPWISGISCDTWLKWHLFFRRSGWSRGIFHSKKEQPGYLCAIGRKVMSKLASPQNGQSPWHWTRDDLGDPFLQDRGVYLKQSDQRLLLWNSSKHFRVCVSASGCCENLEAPASKRSYDDWLCHATLSLLIRVYVLLYIFLDHMDNCCSCPYLPYPRTASLCIIN